MDLQLQESSIRCLLQKKGEQFAVGKVRSESLAEEMTLIGFVPYSLYYRYNLLSLKADFNDELIVSPYYVRFSKQDQVLPIYRCATIANGKKYPINEKFQLNAVPEDVLDKLSNDNRISKNYSSYFKPPINGKRLLELRKKITNSFDRLFEGFIEEMGSLFGVVEGADLGLQYIAQNDDIELSGSVTGMTTLTNDILCLCCYMNKVTGLPSYVVLSSNDTIRVMSDDEIS